MKGIVLAGGHATRLRPTSKAVNKHLFQIYDLPLIFFPIMTLRDAGVTDIVLTLGDHECERFYDLLGSGKELGVNLTYHYHGEPKGIHSLRDFWKPATLGRHEVIGNYNCY